MKDYIRFQLQHRRGSSNAIEGVYLHPNDEGVLKEKHEIVFLCTLHKVEGDVYADELVIHLNNKLNNQQK